MSVLVLSANLVSPVGLRIGSLPCAAFRGGSLSRPWLCAFAGTWKSPRARMRLETSSN